MNHETPRHDAAATGAALDDLAVTLDRELTELRTLRYRLNLLRLTLIDGDSGFVQRAAAECEAASREVARLAPNREAALMAAAASLGLPSSATLRMILDAAPGTHTAVLQRLHADLTNMSQLLGVLRDAIRALSEEGRREVDVLLDLGDRPGVPATGGSAPRMFVGEF